VVLAHLKALETQKEPLTRSQWKLRLVKGLYDRNWKAKDIRRLFRLIDWIMTLPQQLEREFRQSVYDFEQEKRMPYVTSIERLAKEEGREEGFKDGLRESIAMLLESRFGEAGRKLGRKVRSIRDLELLRALPEKVFSAQSLADVRKLLE
jgi:hypothetical protein